MSGWGIAETAPVIEEIKAESADYLGDLNSCGDITWSVYDKAFDFYMELISRAYEQGKKDAQPEQRKGEWIDEGFYADGHGAHAFRCSECGGHIIEYDADPFCRWCGADMRGEQDG